MRLMVTLENRFLRTRNGSIYSTTVCDYSFLKRYLQVFDEVVVFARVGESPVNELDKPTASGAGVHFKALPMFIGPMQYLAKRHIISNIAKEAVNEAEAFILRVPSEIGTVLWKELNRNKIPYGVEVVGCSRGAAETCGANFLLRSLLKNIMPRNQRKQCKNACATSYITAEHLQGLYPPGHWSIACSDVDLTEEAIIDEQQFNKRIAALQSPLNNSRPFKICHAGTMAALYKAQDVLIEAISICNKRGFNLELSLLGDGSYRKYFEDKAESLGIKSKVNFLKQLPPGRPVREQLDKADLFILPSLTEGQGRVLIEAMARGLPCIGSDVGGIPELLPESYLVESGNAEKLAEKMMMVIRNSGELKNMASANWQKSKEFRKSNLSKKRIEFFEKIIEFTTEYHGHQKRFMS